MQGSSLTSKSTVILFKTPSDPVSSDQYLQTLSPAYQPHFIPVLEEKYHLDSLLTILQQEKEWEGVVITSRRGAEGWIKAVKAFKENHQRIVDWRDVPLWTVGQTSSDALQQAIEEDGMDVACFPNPLNGGTAKSASVLVPLLLDVPPRFGVIHHRSAALSTTAGSAEGAGADGAITAETADTAEKGQSGNAEYRPYLLIRGDKSLEEIPTALQAAGRTGVETIVYSTTPRPSLPDDIASTLSDLRPQPFWTSTSNPTWLAFFSPSSASFVFPHLPSNLLSLGMKIFAIGETTRAWIEGHGWKVDAVGEEPTAKGLLEAISSVTKQDA